MHSCTTYAQWTHEMSVDAHAHINRLTVDTDTRDGDGNEPMLTLHVSPS